MLSQEEKWLLEEKYNGEKSEAFFADCEKLKAGIPLAYLIGYIPFLNAKIYLDSNPLIPRPETEFWVEKSLTEIRKISETERDVKILDLCAGSGCIGIGILKNCPDLKLDFIEIDQKHQITIEKNCHLNNINTNLYRVLIGDLFSPLTDEKYDFILSNPPYIDPKLDRTEESVKNNEPEIALYGGDDGVKIIEEIITETPQYLKPKGQLWLEHEPEQVEKITELAKIHFSIITHKDQYGVQRFSQLVLE
ncbi:MAG: Release factor glutamine methyltransferase [Parcubacteria bacterium OLB19]|nr:MAG: Release factor glutamine methyltransferase [Parcubacteria bacterium OLB19]